MDRYKGTGPKFIKRGRRVLYRWSDVLVWMDRNTKGSWPGTFTRVQSGHRVNIRIEQPMGLAGNSLTAMAAILLRSLIGDLDPADCKLHCAVWNGHDHPIDVLARSWEDWVGWNRWRGPRDDVVSASRPKVLRSADQSAPQRFQSKPAARFISRKRDDHGELRRCCAEVLGVSAVLSLPADADVFGPRGANPLQCRADEHSLKVSSGYAASAHIY